MGNYLNPGNAGFSEIRNGVYVDKSKLLTFINRTINSRSKLTCISRPRRFGKTFAAQMLCAYYDHSCNSHSLFDDLAIATSPNYAQYLNAYDVIYIDITGIKPYTRDYQDIVPYLTEKITAELTSAYPGLKPESELTGTMANAIALSGRQFVMIIDEWDSPIRETPQLERMYLEFLRSLFKNSQTTAKVFAAAYMTGILPIKKDGSQSAISDFHEYTMTAPGPFAEFVGFTEDEVRALCTAHDMDFTQMKRWYDGYILRGAESIYNPNSVMRAIANRSFGSYWTQTSAADSLLGYIDMDFDGLSKTVAELIAGIEVPVDILGFSNDLITFRSKDDVLTLLIHLGYLTYNDQTGQARIPNEEIRLEFSRSIHFAKRDETMRRVAASVKLIQDTVNRNADAVAAQIERIHAQEAPLFYNNEQALRSVVKLAYFSYKDHYLQFEELPCGIGYADIVYLPKRGSIYPALVVELKWNASAQTAIDQIKQRHYPQSLEDYGGDILLVGISYDKDAPAGKRTHHCVIEEVSRQ